MLKNKALALAQYTVRNQIGWSRIGRAVDFFISKGFRYVEVPWIVNDKYVKVTYPKDCPEEHAFQTKLGTIVGSAEQSFIALDAEGLIGPSERLVAVSPCFRDHQPDDHVHRNYFIKVELFSKDKALRANKLMTIAGEFFAKEGAILETKKTKVGLDWEMNGLEIGSYGNRKTVLTVNNSYGIPQKKEIAWSYGTGLAEPRFSQALRLQEGLHTYPPFDNLVTQLEDMSGKKD